MDPVTALTATVGVAQGLSGFSQGMQEAANAEAMAKLAETQALQRDTFSRGELDRYLSTVQAARAANGLSATTTTARILANEAREAMSRERLIERANYRQQASNYRASASAYKKGAFLSLATGVAKGGIPLAEYNAK